MSERIVKPFSSLAIALAFFCSSGFAAATDSAPPDREILRMMDLLREMEMIKQMDMLQDMQNLERGDTAAKVPPIQKSAPAKQKESAK